MGSVVLVMLMVCNWVTRAESPPTGRVMGSVVLAVLVVCGLTLWATPGGFRPDAVALGIVACPAGLWWVYRG